MANTLEELTRVIEGTAAEVGVAVTIRRVVVDGHERLRVQTCATGRARERFNVAFAAVMERERAHTRGHSFPRN